MADVTPTGNAGPKPGFRIEHELVQRAQRVEANDHLDDASRDVSRMLEATRDLDRLKDQFFASVSQELRTPLALILGPVERMLGDPATPPALRGELAVVLRNARTLRRHVDDLLDLSRLDAGALAPDHAEVDLVRVVRGVAEHFAAMARERGFRYHLDTPDSLIAQLDPAHFERVLVYLVTNALKFTPDGGTIRISLHGGDGRGVIEVADSGIGVPADQREAVFERFRHLDGGVPRATGGTGLGLPIVRALVRLHGGDVTVADAPEGGACFRVVFSLVAPPGATVTPRAEAPHEPVVRGAMLDVLPRPTAPPPSVTAWPRDGKVLVVDDDAEMRHFLAAVLADRYDVTTAGGAEEALARIAEHVPDVILTDLMMPGVGGAELVRELRGRPQLAATAIVVISALADDHLRIGVLRDGAQDYLVKPVSIGELRVRVGNLIDRKHAEERVAHAEARYRGIVSMAADAIISVDDRQRIVLFNRGAEEIFGWTEAELMGKPLDLLLPPRYREGHAAKVGELAAGGEAAQRRVSSHVPVVGLRKNGEDFPAQAAISRLDLDGTTMFTVVLHDVSDLRRAIQSRDDILGVVAHDLRNPLQQIVLEAQRLARRGDGVATIEAAAHHMERLTQDLLDATRIEAGHLVITPVPMSARSLIAGVVETQHPLAAASDIALTADVAPDLPPVNGDRDRLVQVLENLIGNALKFTPAGGRVTVSAATSPHGVELRVADTGCGIPAADLPHVFDRYWQAQRAERRGIGLGLAIVQAIVQAHGGIVRVASAPGQGTTFAFTLPVAAGVAAERPAVPVVAPAPRTPGTRVLIVDDDVRASAALAELLTDEGYQVETAARGVDGLARLAQLRPAIALVDVSMPGMSGLEFIRQAHARAPHLACLLVTGHAADRLELAGASIAGRLTKPIDFDELLGALASLAENGACSECEACSASPS